MSMPKTRPATVADLERGVPLRLGVSARPSRAAKPGDNEPHKWRYNQDFKSGVAVRVLTVERPYIGWAWLDLGHFSVEVST